MVKGTQWLWRKNPENLTEVEAAEMKAFQTGNLATACADQMRLNLQEIYRMPDQSADRLPLPAPP
ncbi:MAG: transposase [Verrucomicrobiales bacterium]|nr:transposase [Verrucomicrobiales bacterium]